MTPAPTGPEHTMAESKACVESNRRLLAASRLRIAASRRRLNPWFALAGSSESDALRVVIRARLASGALFPVDGRAWGSRGIGKACVVCDEPITGEQVAYEVSRAHDGLCAGAHLRCYTLWMEES
jgi:hypothetical protein